MSRYATVSTDRRADYYAKASRLIAADALAFYTRAERGRRWQNENLGLMAREYERAEMLDASPVDPDYQH